MSHGGLAQIQGSCRSSETPALGDLDECLQLIETKAAHDHNARLSVPSKQSSLRMSDLTGYYPNVGGPLRIGGLHDQGSHSRVLPLCCSDWDGFVGESSCRKPGTGRHGRHNPRVDPMVLGVACQCTPGGPTRSPANGSF